MLQYGDESLQLTCFIAFKLHCLCMCGCAWIISCHFGLLAERIERIMTVEVVWFVLKQSETASTSAVSFPWMHNIL